MAELKLCDVCFMPTKEFNEEEAKSYFEKEKEEYSSASVSALSSLFWGSPTKEKKENDNGEYTFYFKNG